MNPVISIILPTYNGATYISRAIESVVAQSYTDWELLVISDGSTDTTADIVAEYLKKDSRIQYVKNDSNLGIQKSLNRGLHLAQGKYIARIDDDDQWIDTEKLTKQLNFLQQHPGCLLVGTGVVLVDEEDKELLRYLLPETDSAIRNRILGRNCFIHSSVLFDKKTALDVGGYDESKSTLHVEDYDLWMKMGLKGKFSNLPLYAVMFTLRAEGLSSKNKMEQFHKNILLVKKYRNQYPHYLISIARARARVLVYGFIMRVPFKILVHKILKQLRSLNAAT
jgi:glycosyltransferase involved in cell wall biosynthesis